MIEVGVAVLRNTEGKILIGKRASGRDFSECWECPGGKCVPGETPYQAAIRELYEETGVEAVTNGKVIYKETFTLNPECPFTVYAFVCTPIGWTEPALSDCHTELKWMAQSDILSFLESDVLTTPSFKALLNSYIALST